MGLPSMLDEANPTSRVWRLQRRTHVGQWTLRAVSRSVGHPTSRRPRLVVLAIGEGLILLLGMFPIGLAHAATWRCFGRQATIVGTPRPEVITGTARADVIVGRGGNDRIAGLSGSDRICGGGGNDTIDGGAGDDRLTGDYGFDRLDFTQARNAVTVDLAARRATGQGIDRLGGFFIIEGSDYGDTLIGNLAPNAFLPGPGDDTVRGGGGLDRVLFDLAPGPVTVDLALGTASGEGTDILVGIEGAEGSAFDDTLTGNALSNELWGLGGNDALLGVDGDDFLRGSTGNDSLDGGSGTNLLAGGPGIDSCVNWSHQISCETLELRE